MAAHKLPSKDYEVTTAPRQFFCNSYHSHVNVDDRCREGQTSARVAVATGALPTRVVNEFKKVTGSTVKTDVLPPASGRA